MYTKIFAYSLNWTSVTNNAGETNTSEGVLKGNLDNDKEFKLYDVNVLLSKEEKRRLNSAPNSL